MGKTDKVGYARDVAIDDGELGVEKRPDLDELLARVWTYRGRMPSDFKFDRLEANEQE